MKFWDSSALVPFLVQEDPTERVVELYKRDRDAAAAFWASEVHPSTMQLVTLDDRLALAAQREGFDVVDRQVLTRT